MLNLQTPFPTYTLLFTDPNPESMHRGLLFTYIFLFPLFLLAQTSSNMSMLGQFDDNNLPLRAGLAYNEIWGYADPMTGREYAIIGTVQKVQIFDITNPANPTFETEFTGGDDSIWRDMKNYGSYLYCVADEGTEGMMIIDLSDIESGATLLSQPTTDFLRAHNVFVDAAVGRLYIAGSNSQSSGLIVYDLTTDPANPSLLASINLPGGYVHDLYARNNTLYCNHGNNGLYIYDFTNATSPVTLGSLTSYAESGYNHSCWLTNDSDYLVFCDETHGRGVKMLDVSDLNNLNVVDLFRSQLEAPTYTNSIAHNPIIKDDLVYISYYHDGIQVFDISDPTDVTRVGYYDTFNNVDYAGFDGAWGVYPLLPSGNIIGSDVLNGLFVLSLSNDALPVSWHQFQAYRQNKTGILEWSTLTETNNDYFQIERKTSDRFEPIGQVQGAGNSLSENSYRFVDTDLQAGANYYRIKQVDYNGQFSYSPIRILRKQEEGYQLYPNQLLPGQELNILLPEETAGTRLRIYNSQGQWMSDFPLEGRAHRLALPDWQAGMYIAQILRKQEVAYQSRILIR